MAETVRIVHPLIPNSEHDVPAESLVFKMRSGWVKWSPTPEDESKSDETTAKEDKPEVKSEEKDSDSKSDTATTSTTSRSRTADKK